MLRSACLTLAALATRRWAHHPHPRPRPTASRAHRARLIGGMMPLDDALSIGRNPYAFGRLRELVASELLR